jgi:hypothetical protein
MKIDSLILELKNHFLEIRSKYPMKEINFMLGSTVSLDPKQTPYLTPIRVYEDSVVLGAIIFNQVDAMVIAKIFSDSVDKFYIDVEKKLPIDFYPNYAWAKSYGVAPPSNCESNPELGNISQAIRPLISSEKIIPYKANDLTVDVVWTFVSDYIGDLSAKTFLILGLGNLGAKLSLKFVESGAAIFAYGINPYKDSLIVNAINNIKNKATLADVRLTDSLEFAALRSDVIILASSSKNAFDIKAARCSSKSKLVVDIGKGNLTSDALEFFHDRNIPVWRADITDYLPRILGKSNNSYKNLSESRFGFDFINDYKIVSGGWVGSKGDIVVDDYRNPTYIIGICDGLGGFTDKSSLELKKLLEEIIRN